MKKSIISSSIMREKSDWLSPDLEICWVVSAGFLQIQRSRSRSIFFSAALNCS